MFPFLLALSLFSWFLLCILLYYAPLRLSKQAVSPLWVPVSVRFVLNNAIMHIK
jgi:hypothetical protein